jgi:hypothetical protein
MDSNQHWQQLGAENGTSIQDKIKTCNVIFECQRLFEPRRGLTGQILGLLCELLELQQLHIQVHEAHPGQGIL